MIRVYPLCLAAPTVETWALAELLMPRHAGALAELLPLQSGVFEEALARDRHEIRVWVMRGTVDEERYVSCP